MEMVWITISALLTLAIFSFLYKDNPIYKFAEHLLVGASAGYYFVIYFFNSVKPNLIDEVVKNHHLIPLIPGFLGFLILFRLSRKYGWLSRWSIAFYIGTGMGIYIPVAMQANIIEQLRGTMVETGKVGEPPLFNISSFSLLFSDFNWHNLILAINGPILIIGVLCTLAYFFFSKPHKGALGKFAKVGITFLMVGFGASFGYTVMARVSLLIGRMDFLVNTWFRQLFGL
ncbi:MAG: hypothetical protein B6D57_00090 [Candidatus Coatesbacteria bacterium 4484_99]|uniref:Uncharacterized protein n=1 Tax=Candidatus Coatesbacteria bacterium 4484_99 TaxID=1970774 RepID=A0A1W9S3R1_9BACT|nr:MAG: hypothetical protein B6D57_00090 [Candidatus Coatesbacteria bacterium 4484_99]RLC42497.1 MAG: hypothetical protein DRH44_06275 [Candidatus Coatesbacteria bacterium]RLC42565.1 MAG: hypothetical protein DRH51_00480 [Candidatus Coatesbacteria bacterium]RLC42613.1 MAG: hypothetical protein DRH49_03520 [Candidatus Coatesbacteria bacterium]